MAWQPDYVSVGDLKAHMRIDDDLDDVQLAVAITSASRAIDRACLRQFGVVATAEARTYRATWDRNEGLWCSAIDDLMTTTDLVVTVDGAAVSASLYRLEPLNAAAEGWPWVELFTDSATTPTLGQGQCTVAVTARWGWTSVPTTIKQATLIQAAHFFKRREATFGVAGSPDLGNELRLLAKVDPDVDVMVKTYRRRQVSF